jgi:hypothetical protein
MDLIQYSDASDFGQWVLAVDNLAAHIPFENYPKGLLSQTVCATRPFG